MVCLGLNCVCYRARDAAVAPLFEDVSWGTVVRVGADALSMMALGAGATMETSEPSAFLMVPGPPVMGVGGTNNAFAVDVTSAMAWSFR